MSEQVNYHRMKNSELIELCEDYGIKHDPNKLNRQAVIDALKKIDKEADAEQEKIDLHKARREHLKGKAIIMLHNQDVAGGNRPQFVAVGDHSYWIPREKEVIVPKSILGVLNDAVMTVPRKDENGNEIKVNMKRFPYTVIEMGPDA